MVILKKFYLWPIPYGTQARDLLLMLQKERIAPGYAMLHRIWKESRLPQVVTNRDETFRPLYYLFSSRDRNALLMANQMMVQSASQWGEGYEVFTGVSPRTCALIILSLVLYIYIYAFFFFFFFFPNFFFFCFFF